MCSTCVLVIAGTDNQRNAVGVVTHLPQNLSLSVYSPERLMCTQHRLAKEEEYQSFSRFRDFIGGVYREYTE